MERVHLESEIQQVLPPLLDHPSAGVLSSRGWGVDSATRVGLTLPDRLGRTRHDPGFPASWGQRNGSRGYTENAEVDRSKTPPPHIRESESILSLPSASSFRHAYTRPFSLEDIEIRYRICTISTGLTIVRVEKGLSLR